MDLKKYRTNFRFLHSSQKFHIVSNTVLVVLLTVSLTKNLSQDTIVVNGLSDYCEETAISPNWMNDANHEKLGYFLATALGNVTPDTAKYTDMSVMEYVSPEIYEEVKSAMHSQLEGIVKDRITMQFFPEKAFVEDGITFVTGKGKISGPTNKPSKFIRTYEFKFEVNNYTPVVTYIDVYDEAPHDRKWKAKQAKEAKRSNG